MNSCLEVAEGKLKFAAFCNFLAKTNMMIFARPTSWVRQTEILPITLRGPKPQTPDLLHWPTRWLRQNELCLPQLVSHSKDQWFLALAHEAWLKRGLGFRL